MNEPTEPTEEEALDPYRIETARSSRSRCRTCRRKIDKDVLRLGILLEGPYGTGYLWHHLKCAARRRIDDVEEAYAQKAWDEGLEVPPLAELQALKEESEKKRAERRDPPWAERAKSGRSKCKHCDEPIEKGAWRVVVARGVELFGQVRTAPINVHPACVAAELEAEDCATELEGFSDALRAGCTDLTPAEVDQVLVEIGTLG